MKGVGEDFMLCDECHGRKFTRWGMMQEDCRSCAGKGFVPRNTDLSEIPQFEGTPENFEHPSLATKKSKRGRKKKLMVKEG